MENNHTITIKDDTDLNTLIYFAALASMYEQKAWKDELQHVESKRAYEFIPLIVEVKNGYVVLEDKTIRCSPYCSSFVAGYDGCTESEMHADYNAIVRGY